MPMKPRFFLISAIISMLSITKVAVAACHWEGPLIGGGFVCDDGGPLGPAIGPGISYSTVTIRNDCSQPIQVAMKYQSMTCQDYEVPGCSSPDVPASQKWVSKGWWTVNPGQDAYIADTKNANLYLYAEIPGQDWAWSGDHTFSFGGTTVGGYVTTIPGGHHMKYTERYVCPTFVPVTKLVLCNKSGKGPIAAAYAWYENNVWNSKGWYTLNNGECKTAVLGRYKGSVYVHANYNNFASTWGGGDDGASFCVHESDRFAYSKADTSDCSQSPLRKPKFSKYSVGPGKNTWDFTP